MKFSTSIAFAAFAARTQAQLQLNSVTYTGLGCPSGTASITPDRAGTDLLVLFSAFTMELPGMGTKDCALHIDVSGVPSGKLPVFTIMARGFLVLSEGSMATYRATGFWSHDPQSTLVSNSHLWESLGSNRRG
jgi:hypothetical protein